MDNALALEMTGIRKNFGSFRALDGASLEVRWGEVHAILGENGAGKSSLMNVAAGLYSPDGGSLRINGQACDLSGPRDAMARGVGMIHQHFKLVKRFSAVQNVLLANPRGSYRQGLAAIGEEIRKHAETLGFVLDLHRPVGLLSVAEQQRVEIIKTLVAGARILILDEPTAVLTDEEGATLLRTISDLAQRGTAIVLVTHKLRDVQTFADRVTVMRGGRTIATLNRGTPSDELTTLAVGTKIVAPRRGEGKPGVERLIVRSLNDESSDQSRLRHVTFTVRSGEIYGIAGVGGNGQTELSDILSGSRAPSAGHVEVALPGGDRVDLSSGGPRSRVDFGFATVPADRQGQAIASSVSIVDNYAIAHVHTGRFGPWWRIKRAAAREATSVALRDADVQGVRSTSQRVGLLSGGNAQKLVMAREFSRTPGIIIVHSPSRGLDVRACAAIHRRLLAAREEGVAVVLISEDLDEILSLSDRIGVMTAGRIVAEFDAPADRQAIGRAMVGHV
ncbi:ATP-binding cassette domain-containing protein [Bradyrhizobium sp. CCGUVB1N3]|uniref:ABC transporter ATP-binding protein n=1 Tax=Bradyrhizobium sp. CCGUVB1N3 TaxID=2949629 RepID=UPI0020B3D40E|nr:ATP-binding cassette domain-containing protein [Bradyrhizobium sp. CCGUVB1N3]MCP3476730.1 ATP-binding cassette domain-containing protein [Bradyrhizobium sp. CCGUVB1N3]